MSKATTDARDSTQPSAWRWLLQRVGIDMREGEGFIASVLFVYFFALMFAQYITRSVRDSDLVTSLDSDNLPWGFILVAVCSYPILRLFSRLVDRFQRHILIAGTSLVFAASLVLFWWLYQFEGLVWLPVFQYVWMSIAFVMLVSQFWSFCNHSLDPRQAKRLFAFVGAGAGLGGGFGGLYANAVVSAVGTHALLLYAAGIQVMIATLVVVVTRLHPPDEKRVAGAAGLAKLEAARGGFETIRASRHLMLIAALMLCTVAVANIVNLQFLWAKDAMQDTLDQNTADFGLVYSINSFFGFFFHMFFTARIHRRLGIGVAMRILPVSLLVGSVALMWSATWADSPRTLFYAAAILLIGEKGIRYSLDQATRELLFLPVPSKPRFRAKAYIDVFIQRFAKGIGATFVLIGTWFLGMNIVQVGYFSIGIIVAWLAVTVAMRAQFVRSFRDGLLARTLDTNMPIDLSDSTSLDLMAESLAHPDPHNVLGALDMLAYHGRADRIPEELLRHDSPEVRRKALELLLERSSEDREAMTEALLADPDAGVRRAALQELAALRGQGAASLMMPRLEDPDPRVRGTAAAGVVRYGDRPAAEAAEAALKQMAAGPDAAARGAAASAIGELEEPRFQEGLVQLLYDREISVQKAAIGAVRARVEAGGDNPLFLPILISLSRDRRLKHAVREALVAYGEMAIPALVHFMSDPEEHIWVRRAVPKTIARIDGAAAVDALQAGLDVSDQFLRRKIVEALVSLRGVGSVDSRRVGVAIHDEARRYFLSLTDLVSVAGADALVLKASMVRWTGARPLLIHRILKDRTVFNLEIIFGLLALLHPERDMRAAFLALTGADGSVRTHAIEYLDNTLTGDVHRAVFTIIDDEPLSKKLHTARRLFDVVAQPREDVLRRLVVASLTDDEEAHWLGMAAVHAICEEEITSLYPQVTEASRRDDGSVVQETATWAALRLGLAIG